MQISNMGSAGTQVLQPLSLPPMVHISRRMELKMEPGFEPCYSVWDLGVPGGILIAALSVCPMNFYF